MKKPTESQKGKIRVRISTINSKIDALLDEMKRCGIDLGSDGQTAFRGIENLQRRIDNVR